MVAVLTTVALGGLWVGAAVIARHSAQSAADLAALAAAMRLSSGPAVACRAAATVTAAAGGTLRRCDVVQLDVVVEVSVPAGGLTGGPATAVARAGPVYAVAAGPSAP